MWTKNCKNSQKVNISCSQKYIIGFQIREKKFHKLENVRKHEEYSWKKIKKNKNCQQLSLFSAISTAATKQYLGYLHQVLLLLVFFVQSRTFFLSFFLLFLRAKSTECAILRKLGNNTHLVKGFFFLSYFFFFFLNFNFFSWLFSTTQTSLFFPSVFLSFFFACSSEKKDWSTTLFLPSSLSFSPLFSIYLLWIYFYLHVFSLSSSSCLNRFEKQQKKTKSSKKRKKK